MAIDHRIRYWPAASRPGDGYGYGRCLNLGAVRLSDDCLVGVGAGRVGDQSAAPLSGAAGCDDLAGREIDDDDRPWRKREVLIRDRRQLYWLPRFRAGVARTERDRRWCPGDGDGR